ncbi:uncharacterized protein JCM15063_006468 [Sporobolomyces koalae]|uniref:uncharacterized protein n=1 Tax=Sporobolomyces koalae TaxID=500713 RepID=UPI003175CF92
MPEATKLLTIFTRIIDSAKPFSEPVSFGTSSCSITISFSEGPCKCAPTMVCIPVMATLQLEWHGCAVEAFQIKRGTLSFTRKAGSTRERVSLALKPGRFPENDDGAVKVNSFVQSGRERTVEIKLEVELEVPKETPTSMSRSLALIDGSARMDVCLVFPNHHNRKLFASSIALSEISPYWRAQLSTTGFNEDLIQTLDLTDMRDELDTDVELDLNDEHNEPIDTPLPPGVRVLPIHGTPYATYRAFLLWLHTSHLAFAPLPSSFASRELEREARAISTALYPTRPFPCSPCAMYTLAHFLSIPTLARLCLDAYRSSLTLDNAVVELLSSFADLYDDVRKAILDWILEEGQGRWQTLRKSPEVKRWRERITRDGPSDSELEILMRLSGIAD